MENNKISMFLPRMRTISEAYAYIKEADPDTAISANYIRCVIISGKVPRVKSGKKYLVDIDLLIDYLRKNAQGNA